MDDKQITVSDGEREFLQYLHGYPGEPEWLSALIDGEQAPQEPEITEILQVSPMLRLNKLAELTIYQQSKTTYNDCR